MKLRKIVNDLKKQLDEKDHDLLYHESYEDGLENDVSELKNKLELLRRKNKQLEEENLEWENYILRDRKRSKSVRKYR